MAKSTSVSMISTWNTKYGIFDAEIAGADSFQNYQQYRIYSNGAVPIQAMIRGYLCRRNMLRELSGIDVSEHRSPLQRVQSFHVADMLASWDRMYSEPEDACSGAHERYIKLVKAATKIQARSRGHLLRMKLDPASLLNARLLGTWIRRYAPKDPLNNSFAEYQAYRTYFNAAIVVQSLMRGLAVRWFTKRGKILRAKRFHKILNAVIAEYNAADLTKMPFEEYQVFKIYYNSAVHIQACFRGFLGRSYPFGFLPFKLPTSPRAKAGNEQNLNQKYSSIVLMPVAISRKLTKGVTFYLKNEEDSDEEEEKEIILHKSSTGDDLRKPFSLPCSLTVMSVNGSTRGRHYDPESDKNNNSAGKGSFGFGIRDSFKSMQSEEGDVSLADIMNGGDESFWDCFDDDRDSDASDDDGDLDEKARERSMEDELRKIEEIMAFNFEASLALQREVEFDVTIIEGENESDDDEDTLNLVSKGDDEFDIGGSFLSTASTDSLASCGSAVLSAIPNAVKVKTLAKTRSAIERDKARGLSRTDSKVFRKNANAPPPVSTPSQDANAQLGMIKEESDSELEDEEIKGTGRDSPLGDDSTLDEMVILGPSTNDVHSVQTLLVPSSSCEKIISSSADPDDFRPVVLSVTGNEPEACHTPDVTVASAPEVHAEAPSGDPLPPSEESVLRESVIDTAPQVVTMPTVPTDEFSHALPNPVDLTPLLEPESEATHDANTGCIDSFTDYFMNAGWLKGVAAMQLPAVAFLQESASHFHIVSSKDVFDVDEENATRLSRNFVAAQSPVRFTNMDGDVLLEEESDDSDTVRPSTCFYMQPLLATVLGSPNKSSPDRSPSKILKKGLKTGEVEV
jgi:hypothetical protein